MVQKPSTGGVPYLQVHLEVPNTLHGDCKVYGRVWGKERIAQLQDELKKDGKFIAGTPIRLEGFFNQYDGEEGKRYNNFTFHKWDFNTAEEYRATFILVGEVKDAYVEDGEGVIALHICRSGGKGKKDIEEDFILYTDNKDLINDLHEGQTIKAKGLIAEKGKEDYFGDSSGVFRAYVKELQILEQIADPAGEPY